MTYANFPQLKRILSDKRIRRFGVAAERHNDYLMCEQFVIDLRDFTAEDIKEMDKTFLEMKEFGLASPPYDCFVIHAICKLPTWEHATIQSMFCFKQNGRLVFDALFDNEREKSLFDQYCTDPEDKYNAQVAAGLFYEKLLVMLATRGAIRERHEVRRSQTSVGGKPHKRGSGGYTIIRPPEAHEIAGGTHASPRPHLRRGHIRRYDPIDKTKWVWIEPCFVNGEQPERRQAYLVKTARDNSTNYSEARSDEQTRQTT